MILTPAALALLAGIAFLAPRADAAAVRSMPSPAPSGSGEPRLVAGPDSTIAMSWLERRVHGGHRLRWALWNGRRWSAPATIAEGDSFFANWADFPSVRWLGGPRWAAHWLWKSGPGPYAYDVRVSRSRDGGQTWSAPVTPHRDATQTEHGFVSLLRDGQDVRAVWLDGRNFAKAREGTAPDMTLRTAVLGGDGRIAGAALLDPRACECCATAAVHTRRGALVAYRDRDAREVRDIALVRLENGRWTAPYRLHRDGWTIAGCPVNGPAMDAAGDRVAIAWFTAARDTARVLLAFSSDGGRTFGAPVHVDLGAPLGRVGVALAPDGGAHVSWLEAVGEQARVMLRGVRRSRVLDDPIPVSFTAHSRASGFPQVIRTGAEVIVAWTDPGTPAAVRMARVRLDGDPPRRRSAAARGGPR